MTKYEDYDQQELHTERDLCEARMQLVDYELQYRELLGKLKVAEKKLATACGKCEEVKERLRIVQGNLDRTEARINEETDKRRACEKQNELMADTVFALTNPLNDEEKSMVMTTNAAAAINALRNRHSCLLRTAHTMVNMYQDTLKAKGQL